MTLWPPPPLAVSGAEVGAWVAATAGVIALLSQIATALRKRSKEREEIEEALDRSPEVKRQLELGNVGEAVKHLNAIIESQANHIQEQDRRQTQSDNEITRLKERNDALEEEVQHWENRYRESERLRQQDKREADDKIVALQQEMDELKRTFARALVQARQQGRENQ